MLNVTVLRVEHSGIDNARKVIPYIEQADAFSRESAASSEEMATKGDKFWRDLLSRNLSRDKINIIVGAISRNHQGMLQYNLPVMRELYKHRIPRYTLERHGEAVSGSLPTLQSGILGRNRLAHEAFSQNRVADCIENYRVYFDYFQKVVGFRDKEMGRNLAGAEEGLRGLYPNKFGDTINLYVEVGPFHDLSRFTDIPVKTVDLTDRDQYRFRLIDGLADGRTFDDLGDLVYRTIAEGLMMDGLIEGDLQRDLYDLDDEGFRGFVDKHLRE